MRSRQAKRSHALKVRKDRAAEDGELGRICALATRSALIDLRSKPGPQLAALIQSIFRLETVGIYDADLQQSYHAGGSLPGLDELVHSIFLFETVSDDPRTGLSKRVLRLGELPVGSLLIRGEITARTASAVASLVAVSFDRYHALANESRTEAARRAEQLRTTVLDSLAHAYKTPLTAIRAAATGLAEMGSLTPSQSEMASLIDEQTELLSQLTNRLLQTAKLEVKDLRLNREDVVIAPLLKEIAADFRKRLTSLILLVAMPSRGLVLRCDRRLIVALLTEYLENAGKYAIAGSKVIVEARKMRRRGLESEVVFSVQSVGPVIPAKDLERIFDRYFRSSIGSNVASGTGIGLSIARQAAQAHGGRVWVTSAAGDGTTFFAAIPMSPPPENES